MKRIRILPEEVANKIAAGEVVERPASACKELIENAIDAGAGRIGIEIRNGGRSLIRVTDNGCGMSWDDALLCLERHATSKIASAADIDRIETLGFRGEAIPSLAAVSRFRLLTREHDALSGTEIEVNGGRLQDVRDAGCPPGTQVEIRQLFYNVPARKKFLRSETTEASHIHQTALLFALACPAVHFLLRHDEQTVLEAAASSGLRERIRGLYGADFLSELLPVDRTAEDIRITGFTAKPGFTRASRREMHFFINGRPADSRAFYYGVLEGYHNALMKGKYPVCFLFLQIDPRLVDVNIHPAKREVRFRDERGVQAAVTAALGTALGQGQTRPLSAAAGVPVFSDRFGDRPAAAASGWLVRETPAGRPEPAGATANASLPIPAAEPARPFPDPGERRGAGPSDILAFHGIIAQLYILAENDQGLVIIDQHAAHERILYERVLGATAARSAPSQKLLMPQNVELPPADHARLMAAMPLLEKMGFGISEFGKNSILVDALPPFVAAERVPSLFRQMSDALEEAGAAINRDRFAEETIAKTVCRAAVKARDPLKPGEAGRLIQDLLACAQPFCCPHGRPTMIQVSCQELEKKFGRRV